MIYYFISLYPKPVREKEVQFVEQMIEWFLTNKRDLPWRNEKNPYKIWISEIMLQQTRVSSVVSYFNRFMNHFPTCQSLAEASLEDVYKVWEGLGYYSRAKNIWKSAQIIQDKFGGTFPQTYLEIISLPGIGEYTAGAILSIAYNQPYPAVDGNVLRVFARIFRIQKDILDPKTKKEITQLVGENLSVSSPSDYTESIMELGALLCLPKNPKCLVCPVHLSCLAFTNGEQDIIPIRLDKTIQVVEELVVLIVRVDEKIWIEKRAESGLLGGFWQLPNFLKQNDQPISQQIENFLRTKDICITSSQFLFSEKHIYSHRIWKMDVYEILVENSQSQNSENLLWILREDFQKFPIGGAFRKILKRL